MKKIQWSLISSAMVLSVPLFLAGCAPLDDMFDDGSPDSTHRHGGGSSNSQSNSTQANGSARSGSSSSNDNNRSYSGRQSSNSENDASNSAQAVSGASAVSATAIPADKLKTPATVPLDAPAVGQ